MAIVTTTDTVLMMHSAPYPLGTDDESMRKALEELSKVEVLTDDHSDFSAADLKLPHASAEDTSTGLSMRKSGLHFAPPENSRPHLMRCPNSGST